MPTCTRDPCEDTTIAPSTPPPITPSTPPPPPPRLHAAPAPRLLAPTAPLLAEELWEHTGHAGSVVLAEWPDYDEQLTVDKTITLVVQVNGKVRDRLEVPLDIDEAAALELASAQPNVQTHLEGKTIRRVIFVPGRLLNLVVG